MRVLHLTTSVGPRSGGLGAIAIAMARTMSRSGHDAEIWTYDKPDVAASVAAEEAIAIRSLPSIGPAAIGFSPAGRAMARNAVFDVVHQHGIWTALAQITNTFRARGVPTIVAPQGSLESWTLRRSRWKKRIALAAYESRNLRGASALQATSDAEVRSFRAFGLTARVAVIPNGVGTEWLVPVSEPAGFRARYGVAEGERLLLFISRLHPKKGLPLLLEALSRIGEAERRWTLLIAGPDEAGHRGEVERLAESLGISPRVRFTGPLYGNEKRQAYAAADLFVLPTHSDNFAIVVAEALASGTAVLTTHGAPWQEIRDRDAGWWVPVEVGAIRAALQEALALDVARLRQKGAHGREIVRERYTWDAVIRDCLELYGWAAGRHTRPSFLLPE